MYTHTHTRVCVCVCVCVCVYVCVCVSEYLSRAEYDSRHIFKQGLRSSNLEVTSPRLVAILKIRFSPIIFL